MKLLFSLACVIVISLLVLSGCKTAPASLKTEPLPDAKSIVEKTVNPSTASDAAATVETTQTESQGYKLNLIGTVTPDAQAVLTVRMPSRIIKALVHLGDRVRKGQLLVQFDDTDTRNQIRTSSAAVDAATVQISKARLGKSAQLLKLQTDERSAQGGLQQAKQRIQQSVLSLESARDDAKSEITLARDSVRKAQVFHSHALESLQSLEKLAKVGGVSRAELELARLQENTARTDMNSAKTQMKRLAAGPKSSPFVPYRVAIAEKDVESARQGAAQSEAAVRTARSALNQGLMLADQDILSARALADQAKSGLRGALTQLDQNQLISPINGTIAGINARAGETAQPGSPVITVVSQTGLHIEALISARHLTHIRPNLPVVVRVDTMPGIFYNAHISFISHTAEADGRSFRIRFDFDKSVGIQPGVAAEISLR